MTIGKFIIILLLVKITGCTSINNVQEAPEASRTQSSNDLKNGIAGKHPSTYFQLAAQLLNEGKKDEAVKWYYVGQMRFRAYLKANPSLDKTGDPALYTSLKYVVGKPINEYAGGSPDDWAKLIELAIDWNMKNPDDFMDKEKHHEIYAEIEKKSSKNLELT